MGQVNKKLVLAVVLCGVSGYMLFTRISGLKAMKKAYDVCGGNDFQKCVDTCSALVKSGKADYIIYLNRAGAYTKLGKHTEAIADYTASLNLEKDARAYTWRGVNYLLAGRKKEGIDDLSRAIELSPNSVDAHYWRGYGYSRANDFKAALADYIKACDLKNQAACEAVESGKDLFWLFVDKYGPVTSTISSLNPEEAMAAGGAAGSSDDYGRLVLLSELEFLGDRRAVPERKKKVIDDWDKSTGLNMGGLFQNEMKFGRDGMEIWAPVQKMLFAGKMSAVVPGGRGINVVALHFKNGNENIFLIIQALTIHPDDTVYSGEIDGD